MACDPHEFDPRGRQGIGVAQPQSGIDYPLVRPSDDIRDLIADLWFSYDDPADYDSGEVPLVAPFEIVWLYGIGCVTNTPPAWAPTPTHSADIVIRDATGRLAFDSTTASFDSTDWSDAWRIYEWKSDSAVCRLVCHTKWSAEGNSPEPRFYNLHIEPLSARITERAVVRNPKRVKSLSVVLDTLTDTRVDFQCGYNFDMSVRSAGFKPGKRNETVITMSAEPGKGIGRFDDCAGSELYLRRVNSVGGDTYANLMLSGTDCMYVRQPTVLVSTEPRVVITAIQDNPTAAHLQVGDDCGPCCDCDDFISLAEDMNNLRDDYVDLGNTVMRNRTLYHSNRDRWLAGAACREVKPIRVAVLAQTGPYVDIAGQFCNQSGNCRTNIALVFTLSTTPEDFSVEAVELVCGGTLITTSIPKETNVPYVLQGGYPVYTALWDTVNAFDSVKVRFRLRLPNGGVSTLSSPYAITVALTALENGNPIKHNGVTITANKTITLNSIDTSC